MDTPRSITHFETDSFFFALDQLIREQVPVVITVPVKPPSGSGLYKRLQFCQSLIDTKDPSCSSKLGSARFFAKLSKFVFTKLLNRPNYRGYFAKVHSESEPLEIHLIPLTSSPDA